MADAPRSLRWIPLVYYYLATIVGLTILLVGAIGGLNGLVKAAIPQLADEVRYASPIYREDNKKVTEKEKQAIEEEAIEGARLAGYGDALRGLVTAAVGAPVFWWHLRQARRKDAFAEPSPPPGSA